MQQNSGPRTGDLGDKATRAFAIWSIEMASVRDSKDGPKKPKKQYRSPPGPHASVPRGSARTHSRVPGRNPARNIWPWPYIRGALLKGTKKFREGLGPAARPAKPRQRLRACLFSCLLQRGPEQKAPGPTSGKALGPTPDPRPAKRQKQPKEREREREAREKEEAGRNKRSRKKEGGEKPAKGPREGPGVPHRTQGREGPKGPTPDRAKSSSSSSSSKQRQQQQKEERGPEEKALGPTPDPRPGRARAQRP